jgi:hypothetical protein
MLPCNTQTFSFLPLLPQACFQLSHTASLGVLKFNFGSKPLKFLWYNFFGLTRKPHKFKNKTFAGKVALSNFVLNKI